MKVLLQRVRRAEVRVDGNPIGSIGPGLLVFIGVEKGDGEEEARDFARRTAGLRIFADGEGRMNRSVIDAGGEALVVSQFTLAGTTRKGRRPSFDRAADPGEAERLYGVFAGTLEELGVPVARGRFGAFMEVDLVNDGPVTFLLDPRAAARGG